MRAFFTFAILAVLVGSALAGLPKCTELEIKTGSDSSEKKAVTIGAPYMCMINSKSQLTICSDKPLANTKTGINSMCELATDSTTMVLGDYQGIHVAWADRPIAQKVVALDQWYKGQIGCYGFLPALQFMKEPTLKKIGHLHDLMVNCHISQAIHAKANQGEASMIANAMSLAGAIPGFKAVDITAKVLKLVIAANKAFTSLSREDQDFIGFIRAHNIITKLALANKWKDSPQTPDKPAPATVKPGYNRISFTSISGAAGKSIGSDKFLKFWDDKNKVLTTAHTLLSTLNSKPFHYRIAIPQNKRLCVEVWDATMIDEKVGKHACFTVKPQGAFTVKGEDDTWTISYNLTPWR